jgi:hypothetical protein
MRYFFHIVDKYGLSPDGTGCECADQDAAVLHARRIAAELAKAGEFFRASFVLVALAVAPGVGKSPLEAVDQFPASPLHRIPDVRTGKPPLVS